MDPHFSVCFLTWYSISFKKNLGSLNYYGPKKSFVNVASLLKCVCVAHMKGNLVQVLFCDRELASHFYIQSIWLNMLQWTPGCLSVCLCVCLCVCVSVSSLQPKRMDGFWWNFPQITYYEFARSVFLRFWKFKFDDVMAAIIAVFGWGTLTVAILLRFSSNFRTC